MLRKPTRNTDILTWAHELVDEIRPLLNMQGDGQHIGVDGTGPSVRIRFAGSLDYPFRAVVSGTTVLVSGGYAQAFIRGSMTAGTWVAAASLTYTSGHSVYLAYTHRTPTGTAGSWGALQVGAMPANTYDVAYIKVADLDDSFTGKVKQAVAGALIIEDAHRGQTKLHPGALSEIPEFWEAVTSYNNRFLVGAGGDYAVGDEGGSDTHDHENHGTHTLSIAQHQVYDSSTPGAGFSQGAGGTEYPINATLDHDITGTDLTHDGHSSEDNRPRYKAIYLIQRK